MKRYGVASGPRVRATPNSKSFREQAARQGTSGKAKNNERKLSYEK
jgi:hypothetical protein